MSEIAPHIADLIAGHVDGVLSDAEAAEFAEALASDASVVAALADAMRLDATIGAHYRGGHREAIAVPETPDAPSRWRIGPAIGAIAAALLITAATIAVYLIATGGTEETSDAPRGVALATVTDAQGAAWRTDPLNAGDEVTDSDVAISDGEVELTMRGGGDVRLVGPTALRLTGVGRVHLNRGTIDVHSKAGFTVTLDHGVEVVDLGTEFTVNAYADGRSSVSVRQGHVRVKDAAGNEHALTAGLVASIDDAGMLQIAQAGGPFDADLDLLVLYRPGEADERAGRLINRSMVAAGRFDGRLGDGVNATTAPAWAPTGESNGRVLRFTNAELDRVAVAGFDGTRSAGAMTVAVRLKLTGSLPWQIVATQWDVDAEHRGFFHLAIRDGRPTLHWSTDESDATAPTHELAPAAAPTIEVGRWVDLAATMRAGGDVALYVDGVEVGRAAYGGESFPSAAATEMIFGTKHAPDPAFEGEMGRIAVFGRVLSPAEIERLALDATNESKENTAAGVPPAGSKKSDEPGLER